MNNKERIGVGIITCSRENYFIDCLKSLDNNIIDYLVIVNDGQELSTETLFAIQEKQGFYIKNKTNLGVSKTKNKALKYLLEKECVHIFLLEDDCIIANNDVWNLYINAYKETGIPHFNYGPGSPWNRKQNNSSIIGDLSKRHLADQTTPPNPKLVVGYKNDLNIALYEHIVAMFTYFHKSILDKVGLLDEEFYNAWEHVEHTYRIIKADKYSPFWWFADVENSQLYINEAKDEKANTSLAKDEKTYYKNIYKGLEHFYKLHSTIPSQIQPVAQDQVIQTLKNIYDNRFKN